MAKPREGSLGFGLVDALVRQIGGGMTVDGSAGVSISIDFLSPQPGRSPAAETRRG